MAELSQKDLAVVIVSWNVKDALLANLESVFGSTVVSFDVIVVDNASSDGTVDAVRASFPEVTVIANTENVGFAKGCNQGIQRVTRNAELGAPNSDVPGSGLRAPHVLLLNPDMRVEPDALAKTVAYLDAHPDVAVVGARLIGQDGKVMRHLRRFPSYVSQVVIALKLQRVFKGVIANYMGEDLDLEKEQDVDSVRGSYFAINRTALEKIGMLDERYFIWMEEVDYCRQAKQKGMRVRYVPSIVAHDLVGRSFAQRNTWWKRKQFATSMATYFWKWL